MNRDLIQSIVKYQSGDEETKLLVSHDTGMKFYYEDKIVEEFFYWLYENGFGESMFDMDVNKNQQIIVRDGKTFPALTSKMKPIRIIAAGKNFATFDKKFLEKLLRWQQCIRVQQRVIDPAILYMDWKNDSTLPNLSECKVRAGLPSVVTHNALEDAWDTLLVTRNIYK